MLPVSRVIVKNTSRFVPPSQRRLNVLNYLRESSRKPGRRLSRQTVRNPATLDSSPASKSARAYATTYTSGPPLVPALVVDSVMQYITKINIRKKLDFVLLVCKYWSLKREARRGAPLLKRLHLEPWTASNSGGGSGSSEADNLQKLECRYHLFNLS
jgi:hypothetical protein